MNRLRVENKGSYEIEVNDKGEKIYLNLNDTRLLGKLLNMLKDIDEKQKEYETKLQDIVTREDKPLEGFENTDLNITQNFVDYVQLTDDFCTLCKGYVDDIFGKGASEKIFGDRNDPDMFGDFIEALEPHLQNANINMKNMKKDLVKKYKKDENGEDVI